MVIRLADGRETTIDYREVAPSAARRDMFLDEHGESRHGAQPRGSARRRACRAASPASRSRSDVRPDCTRRRDGARDRPCARRFRHHLARSPTRSPAIAALLAVPVHRARLSAARRCRPRRRASGSTQPDLAATLQDIAQHGPDAFYHGHIARSIAARCRARAVSSRATISPRYQALERAPRCRHLSRPIASCRCPPRAPGAWRSLQMLNILEVYPLARLRAQLVAAPCT